MSIKFVAVSLLSTLTLAACGSGSNNTPLGNTASAEKTKAAMLGPWFQECTTKDVAWDLVGVGSQRVKATFAGNSGTKTFQLYSDAACNKQVGQVVYTLKTDTGAQTSTEDSSWIDINYQKAELTISDQTVLDKVNASPVAACGIKTWQLGKAQDISSALGSTEAKLTCPFMKTGDVYDIVKSDGQTMYFGKVSAGYDKSTREARPQALDKDASAIFRKE